MIFAVCAIAKLENHYVREWADHYFSIGFDKIILYDNNDSTGECLADPIKDYVESQKIDIIDVHDKIDYQVEAYNDCYQKYADKVDWILFIDLDEFLVFSLPNIHTIQDFIALDPFNTADLIAFPWVYYDDNNLITVENNNYNLEQRFTQKNAWFPENLCFKELIKTKLTGISINSAHVVLPIAPKSETNASIYNSQADLRKLKQFTAEGIDYHIGCCRPEQTKNAYLKHFRYKTLQEFLELKCNRGYPMPFRQHGKTIGLYDFFLANKATKEKLAYAEKWLEDNKDKLDSDWVYTQMMQIEDIKTQNSHIKLEDS